MMFAQKRWIVFIVALVLVSGLVSAFSFGDWVQSVFGNGITAKVTSGSGSGAVGDVTSYSCTDSDGGQAFETKGTTLYSSTTKDSTGKVVGTSGPYPSTDKCTNSTRLLEYYCNVQNAISATSKDCASCQDGRCVAAATTAVSGESNGTSGASFLYNYTGGDRAMKVSSTVNGESYVIRFTNFFREDYGSNGTDVEYWADGGWVTKRMNGKSGDSVTFGSIVLAINDVYINYDNSGVSRKVLVTGSNVVFERCASLGECIASLNNTPTYLYLTYNYSRGDRQFTAISGTEQYYLRFTDFMNDDGVNKTGIQMYANGNYWLDVCESRSVGDTCTLGSIVLTIQSISPHPDRTVVVRASNTVILIISGGLIPENITTCTDSDGGLNYNEKGNTSKKGWGDTKDFCLDATELSEAFCNNDGNPAYARYNCPNGCRERACVSQGTTGSTFKFESKGNHIETTVKLKDGTVVIPLLYGNGTAFLDFGKSNTNRLSTGIGTQFTGLVFNYTQGDRMFILSSFYYNSSYLLRFTDFMNDNGVNKTALQRWRDGNWVTICYNMARSSNCTFDGIRGYVSSVSPHPDRTVEWGAVSPGGTDITYSFIIDANGNVLFLGSSAFNPQLPVQKFEFNVGSFNPNGSRNIIQTYRAYWKNGQVQVQCIQGCESEPEPPQPAQACSELIAKKGALREAYGKFDLKNLKKYREEFRGHNATVYLADYINDKEILAGFSVQTIVFDENDIDALEEIEWLEEIKEGTWKLKEFIMEDKSYQIYVLVDEDEVSHYIWSNNNTIVFISASINTGGENKEPKLSDITDFISALKSNEFKPVNLEDKNYDFAREAIIDYLNACRSQVKEECSPNWEQKIQPVVCPESGYQNYILKDTNRCSGGRSVIQRKMQCSPGICSGCLVPRYFGFNVKGDNVCVPYGTRLAFEGGDEEKINEGSGGIVVVKVINGNNAELTINLRDEKKFYELVEGGVYYFEESPGDVIRFRVEEIVFVEAGSAKNYIIVTTIEGFDGYCNYDGEINAQKNDNLQCQNNYECQSNFCSAGECIPVKEILKEARGLRGLFVTVLCRLSSFFGDRSYGQCVAEFLGNSAGEGSSGGGGGGGSSGGTSEVGGGSPP